MARANKNNNIYFAIALIVVALLIYTYSPGQRAASTTSIIETSAPEVSVKDGFITATFHIKNQGASMTSPQMIEIQPTQDNLQAIVNINTVPCNPAYPRNVHATYQLNSGEERSFTLSAPVTSGTYSLRAVSTDKCCTDGTKDLPCQETASLYGWGKTIGSNLVVTSSAQAECDGKSCNGNENFQTCPTDCISWCGDGICDPAKESTNCGECQSSQDPLWNRFQFTSYKVATGDNYVLPGGNVRATFTVKNTYSTKDTVYVESLVVPKSYVYSWGYAKQGTNLQALVNPSPTAQNAPNCFGEQGFVSTIAVTLEPGQSGTYTVDIPAPSETTKLKNGTSLWIGASKDYALTSAIYYKCYSEGDLSTGIQSETRNWPVEIHSTTSSNTTLRSSYTFDDWMELSNAGRMRTVCNYKEDCAPYVDLRGTNKTYNIQCSGAGQIVDKLSQDAVTICDKAGHKGSDWKGVIGVGAVGAVGGCAAGAIWLAPLGAAGGSVVPVAGTAVVGGIGAVTGCIIGGVAGAIGSGIATASIQDWVQIDCQAGKYDGIAGACIATPTTGVNFDLMQWITDNTGLTGTSAYVALGLAVIIVLVLAGSLINPPKPGPNTQ